MRIRVRHQFKYMLDNVKTHTLETGEYEVPRQVDKKVADLAIEFGNAVIIPGKKKKTPKKKMAAKKAPENKLKKVKETK